MRRQAYGAFAAGLAAFVASSTAMAKEGSGGMPQLDYHSFAPQLVWLAIAFLALYLVMSRLAVPAISDTIDRRQAKIQGDLDAAEKANEDTRSLVAAYEKRLAVGLSDTFLVIQAQRDLTGQLNNELAAIIAYNRALIALEAIQIVPPGR